MQETEFLVLRLYGPLAAWGDVAVGEVRPILTHPTKSALLGLLGAALGIRRDEAELLSRMADSYGFAVASEGRGTRIRDFHTVQSAPQNKEKEYGSGYMMNRQRELSIPVKDMETTLTYRDYICDVIYTAVVWVKNSASVPFDLSHICDALCEPVFVPYLGRKSCVLSRPMQPQIVSAGDPMQAVCKASFYGDSAKYSSEGRLFVYPRTFKEEDRSGQFLFEGEWKLASFTEEVFRDEPKSRTIWQFGPRRVKRTAFCRGGV